MNRYVILACLWFLAAGALITFLVIGIRRKDGSSCMFGYERVELVKEKYFTADEIDTIDAKLISDDLKIFLRDDEQYCIRVFDYKKRDNVTIRSNKGTLYLEQLDKNVGVSFFIGIHGIHGSSPHIEIGVPKTAVKKTADGSDSVHLLGITVNGTSCDIRLEGLKGENINVATVSGDLYLHDCTFKNCTAHTTSGDICGAGALDGFTITSVSGDCRFSLRSELTAESSYRSTSGDFRLKLPESTSGLSVTFYSSSGDYRNAFTGISAEYITDDRYKTGTPTLAVETVSGDCRIEKIK